MSAHRVSAALLSSVALLLPAIASAQPSSAAPAPAAAMASAAAPATMPDPAPMPVAAPAAPTSVHLAEGVEVSFTLDDALSSATAAVGDRFGVTISEPVTLADGTVIAAGYRGRGEVSSVEKKGMLGKAGQINVRLDYVMVGDTKVPLRASQSQEGKSTQSTTIVLAVVVSPLFLLMKGKDATIPKGSTLKGYIDAAVDIAAPLASPPTPG
jgi:hypothetical protein